ncbi:uncharacterized protein C5orf52 homolog [Nannospalax galili]|uniref:uncharacterized protein C5orf52 homolog n=1 Tax=Nannospalax galili TaxID=1026970 RepID=UPI00111C7576|nr:uncharacterized protein C5orf52 homolog [Nannospalax galili]
MVFNLATVPESLSRLIITPKQLRRPSVRRDLGSELEAVAKATALASLDFRRDRLDSGPDLGFRCYPPQICFLRPLRPATPQTRFRCSLVRRAGAEGAPDPRPGSQASDKTKRKMSHLHDYLKKKFMTDQLRKMLRWRRESLSTQQYLDSQRILKLQAKVARQPP